MPYFNDDLQRKANEDIQRLRTQKQTIQIVRGLLADLKSDLDAIKTDYLRSADLSDLNSSISTINNNNVATATISEDGNTLTLTGKYNGVSFTREFRGGGLEEVPWGILTGSISNQSDLSTALGNKVDKVEGYSLMSSDEHTKLSNIESGAEVNDIEDIKINNTSIVSSKIANITVDDVLHSSSTNLVQSNAIASFVNSSIATNTANFIGTFSNIGLLTYNGYLVAGSILLAGSVLKAGSQMGETTLTEDLTLDDYLTLDENGMLAMGSTIVTGSTIEAGSVLNNVYYEEDTTLANDLTLRVITNNDYAFVTNSQSDFSSVADMESQSVTALTNYDYGWIANDDKYDLYRFDITTQTWTQQATEVTKTDVTPDRAYNRYKYVAATNEWVFEYTLNNSSFTAEQWAAINSGFTSTMLTNFATAVDSLVMALPTKLPGTFVTQDEYDALVLANEVEQDTLYIITDDTTATQFTNMQTAISNLQTAVAGKQDTLTFDNSPTYGSNKLVKSGAIYDALALKQTKLTQGSGITISGATISADLSNLQANTLKSTGVTGGYILSADGSNGTQWIAPTVIKTHCIEVVTSGGGTVFNFQIVNGDATAFTEASIITYLGATAKINCIMRELTGSSYDTYAGTLSVVSDVLTFHYTNNGAIVPYQFDGTETLTDTVL